MKKIICHIVFTLFAATNVSAQTTYSFSGLTWGDSIQVVDNKLKGAGFSGCGVHEKLFCKAVTTCRCQIEGPAVKEGWAELTDNKLVKVFVRVDDWRPTFDVLTRKYGQPKSGSTYVSPFEEKDPWIVWTTSSGESIELLKSHSQLIYTSGAENRKSQAQNQSNKSVF